MKQKIQISIPKPCNAGWDNMTPVEKGRFCSSCQKTVLDFTYLTDNEIIKVVSKNDDLCGRISENQLNRNLIATTNKPNYFGYFATSVFAFLGLGLQNANAQEPVKTEQLDIKNLNDNTLTDALKTITGKVAGEDGPLTGAIVKVVGTTNSVSTGFDGSYIIKAKKGDVLEFSFVGAPTKTMTVGEVKNVNMYLKGPIMEIGTVIYIDYDNYDREVIIRNVQGKVSFKKDKALPIKIENLRTHEVVTINEKGEYSVDAGKGDILQFSGDGFDTIRKKVNSKTYNLRIKVKEEFKTTAINNKEKTFLGRIFNRISNWFK